MSIIAQAPAAGTKVKKGTSVLVTVAVASRQAVKVPNVVGLTPVTADTTLRAARADARGGVAAAAKPQRHDRHTDTRQGNGRRRNPGSGVPQAPQDDHRRHRHQHHAAANGGGDGSEAAKAVAIPAIAAAGGTIAAAAKLSQAGLVPTTIKQFSTAPAGTLVGTNPPAGKSLAPGAKVTLIVSAGFPQVSYDNHSAIKLVDGASGKATVALPPPPPGQLQDEASWSADGSRLVYVQGPVNGGQLMQIGPGKKGAQPTAVTAPGAMRRYPAFAPTASRTCSRSSAPAEKSCASETVGPNPLNPNCTSHPGWTLGRQVAWAPGGREILVFGVQNGRPGTFGLIQFLSNVANSGHATDWGQGKVVTSTTDATAGCDRGRVLAGRQADRAAVEHWRGLVPRGAGSTGDYSLAPPAKVTAIARVQGGLEAGWSGPRGGGCDRRRARRTRSATSGSSTSTISPGFRRRSPRTPTTRSGSPCRSVADVPAATAPIEAQRLVLVLPDGSRVPIERSLTIGRGAQANIRIDDQTVSRVHARIVLGPDGPVIEDAGSRFGVVSRQTRWRRRGCTPGAQIRVGNGSSRAAEAPRDWTPERRTAPASPTPIPNETIVVPIDATLMGLRAAPAA